VKPKRGWYVFWLFFEIGLGSAISFKRSRRELPIDVAEHRSMLENYQNMHYPRFSFIPKTGIVFLQKGFCFFSVALVFTYFRYKPMFSLVIQKISTRAFYRYECRSSLKNYMNYPRFILGPKTGKNSLKQVFRFYCAALVF